MIYVGIPTINNKKYLQETIDSIKYSDMKCLLIDNLSAEETRNYVAGKKQDGFDVILNPDNYGVSRSWNQIINWGLSHDNCEIIFILNNDIVLHENAMNMMVDSVRNHSMEGVSGVNIGNDPIMLKSFEPPKFRWSPAMNFSCFGLTPRCIKRVGIFDEGFKLAYFEDNDYHHRMNLEGVRNHCDMWAAFTHYGSRSIREGGVKHEPFFSNNREYFRNKWGFVPG